jgi:V/A-type H+-transporting ATPase subunit F
MNYKIAIVGTQETVGGFALLGVDVVGVSSNKEAIEKIFELKKNLVKDDQGVERNQYGIVFVTEDLMTDITPDDQKKLSRGALPAVIALPSRNGSSGYSEQRLRSLAERAIGSDILS